MTYRALFRLAAFVAIAAFLAGCGANEQMRKESEAHYKMGVSKMLAGNNAAALYEFTISTQKDSYNAESYFMIGVIYYEQEQYEKAVDNFKEAISINSDYPDAHNNLGLAYVKLKQYDKALKEFRKAADNPLYQTRHNAMINIGLLYDETGEHEKSADAFRESLLVMPTNVIAMMNLAKQDRILGRDDDAMEQYNTVIKYVPGYVPAHYELAVMYRDKGDIEDAKKSLEKVLELSPDSDYGKEAKSELEKMK